MAATRLLKYHWLNMDLIKNKVGKGIVKLYSRLEGYIIPKSFLNNSEASHLSGQTN